MEYRKQLKQIYRGMWQRCYYKKHNRRKLYKNINICEAWQEFSNFYKWSIDNGYMPGLTLDRRNGGLDYGPDNCRWTTAREQALNRTTTSKLPGCYKVTGASTYRVQLSAGGRAYYLGTTSDQELGHLIYQIAAEFLDGTYEIAGNR